MQAPIVADRSAIRTLDRGTIHDNLVATYHYATIGRGAVNYYKLTPLGFQVFNGPQAVLPNRAFFQPVSMALQERTRCLADFPR